MSRTQRVTESDIAAGRIRIPIGQKEALPTTTSRIEVRLHGETMRSVAWNPRYGPDRERSGVIHIGSSLRRHVGTDEVLTLQVEDGVVVLA